MHSSVYEWVGKTVADRGLAGQSVIEVGSCNVNGTVRDFFSGQYVGVDVSPGNGVDRVEDCEHLSDPNAAWDVVVSTEALEHVRRPHVAVNEMARICKPGGTVLLTARGYDNRGCWEVHSWPNDVTRFSALGMQTLAEDAGLTVLEVTTDPEGPGFFLLAVK